MKQRFFTLLAGVALGLALLPAAKAGVATLTATPSTQPIYVDGVQIPMTAYAINGNNYVKLRDIGQAVDFNVYWDGVAVQIEADKPYTGVSPATQPAGAQLGQGDGYLTNGKPITEQNVMELLHQIEAEYPEGTVWGTKTTPGTGKNEIPSTVSEALMGTYNVHGIYGCGGYAAMVSSKLFGDKTNAARRVTDLSQIRPGDIIFRVSNKDGHIWHVEVSLESPDPQRCLNVTGGNCGGTVCWPAGTGTTGMIAMDCFGPGKNYRIEAWTRYPESVPFAGSKWDT